MPAPVAPNTLVPATIEVRYSARNVHSLQGSIAAQDFFHDDVVKKLRVSLCYIVTVALALNIRLCYGHPSAARVIVVTYNAGHEKQEFADSKAFKLAMKHWGLQVKRCSLTATKNQMKHATELSVYIATASSVSVLYARLHKRGRRSILTQ